MTESQFDQIIREKLRSYEMECEVPESLWDGIVAKMAAQRRRKVILRFVYGAVAAAACVALGLFLFNGSDAPSQLQSAPSVAVVESVVPEELETPAEAQDIPSIADQIKSLRSGNAVAEVLPTEAASIAEAVPGVSQPADGQAASAAVAEESQQPAGQDTPEANSQPAVNTTYRTPSGGQLMDDYYLFEDEDTKPRTHASLSISSNVSGIAKQGGFVAQMAPAHSSSVSGKSAGLNVEEQTESSYSIPLSFGVQMRFPIAEKVSLGAGVNYTYLQRNFSGLVDKVKYTDITSRQHYMGLTASVFYDFIREGNLTVYGRAGGAVDKAVSAKLIYGNNSLSQLGDVSGVQWSVNAGVGLEYMITKPLSLFIDPSASYYFESKQPKSIRTEQPLMFSLEAGLRFNL